MKKLMIAAAIVCAAAMTQAASFTWKTSGNLTTDGSTIATGMTGSLALVYLGDNQDAIDWTKAEVVQTGKPTFVNNAMGKSSKTSVSFLFDMADYGNGDIFGVVFQDGDKLYYLTDATGAKMDPTYTISGLTKDNDPLASFDFSASSYQANTSMPVQSVPEPTSGLLLLLGVAGMALRRRRA